MFHYYDKVVKGTEREDSLVIVQHLQQLVGSTFQLLNYYKEIPVSYDARLISVENEMAEFEVHDYQAKVIALEHMTLIRAHEKFPFREDIVGEAFYVNIARKKTILCKFGYARIRSDMRRFVRVVLDIPVQAELIAANDMFKGRVVDISLGGACLRLDAKEPLPAGIDVNLFIRLPNLVTNSINEIALVATVVKVWGEAAPFNCIVEFHPEKHSQQQISYYINQRQVEIIKELKDLVV
jgi:hypothetical protein